MISKKLSLNKVCIILATTILLLSVVMFSVLYILTKEMSVVFCSMAFWSAFSTLCYCFCDTDTAKADFVF